MAHKNGIGLPYYSPRREWMLKLFEEEAEKSIKQKNINFGKLESMRLKSMVQNLPGRKLITCTVILPLV